MSAGNDQIIRLWDYQKGQALAAGYGHSGAILTSQYSPNGKFIVSGDAVGGIIIWKIPEEYLKTPEGGAASDPQVNRVANGGCGKGRRPDENINQLMRCNSKTGMIIQSPAIDITAQPLLCDGLDPAYLCGGC